MKPSKSRDVAFTDLDTLAEVFVGLFRLSQDAKVRDKCVEIERFLTLCLGCLDYIIGLLRLVVRQDVRLRFAYPPLIIFYQSV